MIKAKIIAVLFMLLLSATSASASIIFEEHFSGNNLPAGWDFDSDGSWTVIDNELSQGRTYTSAHATASVGDLSWTDYQLQTRFKFLGFGPDAMESGIILRAGNGRGVVLRNAWRGDHWNLELLRNDFPEYHIELGQNLSTGNWYTMKAQIEGDLLQVWVNDTLYDFGDISPYENAINSSGFVGLWSNNANTRFDDLMVSSEHVVPEPTTSLLFVIGVSAFVVFKRLKFKTV